MEPWAPCTGSVESWAQDQQGSTESYTFKVSIFYAFWYTQSCISVTAFLFQDAFITPCKKVKVVSDSLGPHGLHRPWNSPGQNTGVGSCSLLQGIFPAQGLDPGLPHCRRILYHLSHPGESHSFAGMSRLLFSQPAVTANPLSLYVCLFCAFPIDWVRVYVVSSVWTLWLRNWQS